MISLHSIPREKTHPIAQWAQQAIAYFMSQHRMFKYICIRDIVDPDNFTLQLKYHEDDYYPIPLSMRSLKFWYNDYLNAGAGLELDWSRIHWIP